MIHDSDEFLLFWQLLVLHEIEKIPNSFENMIIGSGARAIFRLYLALTYTLKCAKVLFIHLKGKSGQKNKSSLNKRAGIMKKKMSDH